jgi:MFS transporter, SP family, inositol transporter
LFGRKRIYQYDLLLYAFGTLLMVFAFNSPMLFIGTFLVGIAVGADVPTSLALVGELAPSRARGKLMGLTQVAWTLGPVTTLVLALVLAPYGLLGIRIVFAHLFVVAIVTWALRQGIAESARWTAASGAGATEATSDPSEQPEESPVPRDPLAASNLRNLLIGPNVAALLFTGTVYTFWNLAAGSYGFFLPYLLSTVGSQSQAASVGLQCLKFIITLVVIVVIFMPLGDGRHRRLIFGVGAVLQVVALLLFVFFPLNGTPGFNFVIALANIILLGVGFALAGEQFYKVWSQELFPTMIRGTAQGLTFAVARVALGIWSFFLPVIAEAGFVGVALILTIFLIISGVVGFLFMPNTAGKSLEEIEAERTGQRAYSPMEV